MQKCALFTMKSLEIIARGNPVPYGAHAFASYLNELVPDDPIAITFLYALPEKSSVQLDIDGSAISLRQRASTCLQCDCVTVKNH